MKFAAHFGDRTLFPKLQASAYLAHAAISPPSQPVQVAVSECLESYATRGVAAALAASDIRRILRGRLATLLNADADDIGLVQSTSVGIDAIARSLPFRAGERIVVFEGEFPANFLPWQSVAREKGLSLEVLSLAPYLRSEAEGLAALEQALAHGVRLVAVSAVQFQTGLHMPLKQMAALCHARGAELFVDAIQALGAVPCDVRDLDIDYLAAGAHKFLMGIEGCGVLYVHPRCMQRLSLGLAGWTGVRDPFAFLLGKPDLLRYDHEVLRKASFVEQGAIGIVNCAALCASLELLLGLGVERIFDHVTRYLDALEPRLTALGFQSLRCPDRARRSASLALRPPAGRSADAIAHALHAQGVVVSTPDGFVRVAPHFPNALAEIEPVVRAFEQALS